MRSFVATYNINCPYSLDKTFDIMSDKNIKYKFCESSVSDDKTICYVTIIAKNRLQLRKFKKECLNVLKRLGKVDLVVSVG